MNPKDGGVNEDAAEESVEEVISTSRLGSPNTALNKSLSKLSSNGGNSNNNAPPQQQQQYIIDIDTDVDQHASSNSGTEHIYNDKRITATKLKQLLLQRPDITKLLGECLIDCGLANTNNQL